MRIAQLLPAIHPVPAVKYGGIERIVTDLSLGLSDKGHQVSIYTCSGSTLTHPNITLEFCSPYPTIQNPAEIGKYELHQFLRLIAEQDKYDLIHVHIEPIIWSIFRDSIRETNLLDYIHQPLLVTFHNQTYIDQHIAYYQKHQELWNINYSFISNKQKEPLSFLPKAKVVYNGTRVEDFKFESSSGDYYAFLGRINRDKGIVQAIEFAKQAGVKLIIAAKLEKSEQEFFDREVKPNIDGEIIKFIGEVDHQQKNSLLGKAKALINPVQWHEPFGLVAIEALATGTPVITTPKGAMPEIIQDGKHGFIYDSVDDMVIAASKIDTISRQACRDRALDFDTEKMIQSYLSYYEQILNI